MTEEEFLYNLADQVASTDGIQDFEVVAKLHYVKVLRHIIEGIDPRTTTKDIIFTLNQRLKELESE